MNPLPGLFAQKLVALLRIGGDENALIMGGFGSRASGYPPDSERFPQLDTSVEERRARTLFEDAPASTRKAAEVGTVPRRVPKIRSESGG
jgi:hypothetical protein